MSSDNSYQVAVVGAGPAGCAAALALAQKGVRVALLEKHTFPRYKTCGGGLVGRACRLLPSGARSALQLPFRSVQLGFKETGLEFRVTRPEPIMFTAMRADLDALLSQAARDAGVQVFEANPVLAVSLGETQIELGTPAGPIRAQFVIAADGAHSPVAKLAGWAPLPRLCPALEYEVSLDEPQLRRFSDTVRFDFDVVEGGYGWVFPKLGHLSIGIFSRRRNGGNLGETLERYMSSLGIQDPLKTERHGWLIPLAPRQEALAQGRILLAGDAAGLVDPVTAEGISHALLSGQLAAEAFRGSRLNPSVTAANYLSLLKRHILPELRAGRLLAHLLYTHPRLRNWVFRRKGQALAEFMVDVVMGRRTYRAALQSPSTILKAISKARIR